MKKTIFFISLLLSVISCFGAEADSIQSYTLKNRNLEMSVINYGARIQSLKVNGTDIVLGFDTLENYVKVKQNFGAVVGRYIGRILGGKLNIDGKQYQLQTGGNGDCSHGGTPSFSQRYWTLVSRKGDSMTLRYVSPDGENGFPGELTLDVTYSLTNKALRIDYQATTTKPTVLNPSNHSFFNLTGDLSKDVLDEDLTIYSDSIAIYDANKRVTGQMGSVDGTPFDFRKATKIGARINDNNPQLLVTKGYDHCYQVRNKELRNIGGKELKTAAVLHDNGTGLTMKVLTTEPAMQIYTANSHKGNIIGRSGSAGFDNGNDSKQDGKRYYKHNAICFETMHYPDSPNKPQWPSTVLRPGETFHSTTIFEFR